MNDALGDRMKMYEGVESDRRFLPLLPVIARLDGKCFSSFTSGLTRPFDGRLSDLMVEVVRFLVKETNAVCGYTQSDEITLGYYSSSIDSQIYFDGRVQKLASVLAALCSVRFNRLLPQYLPEKAESAPVFDCRCWQLTTLEEATNAFLWREFDATKNSISMAARHYFSHRELMNKSGAEMQEMLFQQRGINWNDYPAFFKRGSYVQRAVLFSKPTLEEIEKLPPKHNARTNPDLLVKRTEYRKLHLPPLNRVANRVGVIFRGEDPILGAVAIKGGIQ